MAWLGSNPDATADAIRGQLATLQRTYEAYRKARELIIRITTIAAELKADRSVPSAQSVEWDPLFASSVRVSALALCLLSSS